MLHRIDPQPLRYKYGSISRDNHAPRVLLQNHAASDVPHNIRGLVALSLRLSAARPPPGQCP